MTTCFVRRWRDEVDSRDLLRIKGGAVVAVSDRVRIGRAHLYHYTDSRPRLSAPGRDTIGLGRICPDPVCLF